MKKYTTVEARLSFAEVVNFAYFGNETIGLTRRGNMLCCIISKQNLLKVCTIANKYATPSEREFILSTILGDKYDLSYAKSVTPQIK